MIVPAMARTLSCRMVERRQDAPVEHFDSIQMLRAIAVLMVVLYHLPILWPDTDAARAAIPDYLYFGYAGVDLFFVLSGFIITHVTRSADIDVASFVWKRAFRILPLYWAVTALLIVIWMIYPALVPMRSDNPWQYFAQSLLLVPTSQRPLLGVGWTLKHELQFYVVAAVLLAFGLKRWTAAALFVLFAAAIWVHVVADRGSVGWDWKIFSLYAFEFALGVLAYHFNVRWRFVLPRSLLLLSILAFALTAIVTVPMLGNQREVAVVAEGIFGLTRVIGYGLASLLLLIAMLGLAIDRDRRSTPMKRLILAIGNASFAIYLSHNLLLHALAHRLAWSNRPALIWAGVAGAIFLVVIVGISVHYALERPLLNLCKSRVLPLCTGHDFVDVPLAVEPTPFGENSRV